MTKTAPFHHQRNERVIVSQVATARRACFSESANNRSYFLGKIIPYRAVLWVEFEYDTKNICTCRIDRTRKVLGSIACARWHEVQRRHFAHVLLQVERHFSLARQRPVSGTV